MMQSDQKVLLAVLAHPDDETFGMGGTLAYYARKGVQVHLVCATRGDVGDVPPDMLKGFNSVAELRESELRCAAAKLGLAGIHFLNYRDSGMPGSEDNHHPMALAAQDTEKVVADVVHYIRLLKPQIVVTFDPIGGYRHPDHIAIQRAADKAFFAAGDLNYQGDPLPPFSPKKLYFNTMPKTLLKIGVFFMRLRGKDPRKAGKNGDIDLVSIASVSFPVNAVIDYRSVLQVRDEAAACHASQGGGGQITGGLMGSLRRAFAARENYMRAFPEPNGHRERDLFEGLDE